MLTPTHLEFARQGATVYSPEKIPCVIHDVMDNLIKYQYLNEVLPNSENNFYPNAKPLIRTMDRHTFCEWFSLAPQKES